MANGKAGRPHKDLYLTKFGHLLPLKYERGEDGKTYWICACSGRGGAGELLCISRRRDHPHVIRVPQTYLMSGGKRSCGCQSLVREKREKPYYVQATEADYVAANVALAVVTKYGRQLPVAAPATTPPKGEVLNGYIVEDKDGVKWYADANDAIDADAKFDYDTPEYWQALNAAIDKAGRVRATN